MRSRINRHLDIEANADLESLSGQIEAYRTALSAATAAAERLLEAGTQELQDRPHRIRNMLLDPRFRDAVLQLAPSVHAEVMRSTARPPERVLKAKDRAFHRRMYLYAQRLAGKNETTSFFGPLIHGRIDVDTSGIALGTETASGVRAVEAFFSFWAVCALAESIASEPLVIERVPLTWVPACRLEADVLHLSDGRRVHLTGDRAKVADAIDNERGRASIAEETELDVATVEDIVGRLSRIGAVRTVPEPPSTSSRPLAWLIEWTNTYAADTRWPGILTELNSGADRYAEATDDITRRDALETLEAQFAAVSGVQARRAAGRMYADRGIVSIDACGDQSPVLVGHDVACDWEAQLGPVLDVAIHYGELRASAAAGLVAELMRSRGVTEIAYDELIRWTQDLNQDQIIALDAPTEAFRDKFTTLIAGSVAGSSPGNAVLDPETFRTLLPQNVSGARFVSPDIMIELDSSGEQRLVLGELHPYVFSWGSQSHFSDEGQDLPDVDLAPWGGASRLATVIRRRQHKGLVSDIFPGHFIEVTAVATDNPARSIPLSQVRVLLTPDGPKLHCSTGELVLYAGEDDHLHLRAFAAPAASLPTVRFGEAAPRIIVGDVLVQRARWWCQTADLIPDRGTRLPEIVRRIQSMRALSSVPRFCFAGVPQEPKPIGIDLDNPLAVDALAAMLRSADAQQFTLTEMRPQPDQLWLRHHEKPTTSEFRITFTRSDA
ncbi:lantibiotic dehydratase [Rhodococcus sp. 06-235-1A]|uniref:lantibiotic dehydratase n=1 Tax=Rhodococcus sp. 06-235-1A TaxID=2022508 RepID=UPI001C53152B|nr:lantibiotic dehydratase [Rhodococcus sp. 06-235-1A]